MSGTRLAIVSALLLAGSVAMAKPAAKPSGQVLGKAFVTGEEVKDIAPSALVQRFSKAPPRAEVKRQEGGHWLGTIVAFFRKPSAAGPITIWVYEKADKAQKDREPVEVMSVDTSPKDVLVHQVDLDPDNGYNKDHVYQIMVGQIISKKQKIYATGEVKLLAK